jgi:peptidoglycan hydrolase-like protein with peptidoglycan-binding domain
MSAPVGWCGFGMTPPADRLLAGSTADRRICYQGLSRAGFIPDRSCAAMPRNFRRGILSLALSGAAVVALAAPASANYNVPYLRRGVVDNIGVGCVQYFLRNHAGQPIAVDGDFGPETEEAVRTFQRYFNLYADGLVDRSTGQKMRDMWLLVDKADWNLWWNDTWRCGLWMPTWSWDSY